jgi:hypothetical protein
LHPRRARRRNVLVLALLLAGAAACKHSGSAKLEGRWRGTRAEGVAPAVQEQANTFATQTEIVAKGNAITITTPAAKPQSATFTVDDENKTTLVVHTDKDGPANKETFSFADEGRTMTWRLGEGRTIVFTKLKE